MLLDSTTCFLFMVLLLNPSYYWHVGSGRLMIFERGCRDAVGAEEGRAWRGCPFPTRVWGLGMGLSPPQEIFELFVSK